MEYFRNTSLELCIELHNSYRIRFPKLPSSAFGYSSTSFLSRIMIYSDSWSSRETWLNSASGTSTRTSSRILLGSFYLILLREAITLFRRTNYFTSFTSYLPSILQSIKIYFFFLISHFFFNFLNFVLSS